MESNPDDGKFSKRHFTILKLIPSTIIVVSMLIVNSDGFAPSDFDAVFKSAGLDTLSYAPPSSALPASGWPTLGSMINNNTRLVTFLDTGAVFSEVPYLIDGRRIFVSGRDAL